ncbi:MAG: ROK family protein, partial [Deferribacteres bacterium]|nr:ROK family protein [Deferribacteres bacterium]
MKLAIGIDIGGTNTKFVLASEEGKVLSSRKTPTPSVSAANKEKIEDMLVKNLKDFLADDSTARLIASEGGGSIAGIGIGIAGLIDRENGRVIQS